MTSVNNSSDYNIQCQNVNSINYITDVIFSYLNDEGALSAIRENFLTYAQNLKGAERLRRAECREIQGIVIDYLQEGESLAFVLPIIHRSFLSCASNALGETSPNLDWKERPGPICREIDKAFDSVKKYHLSSWGLYNGDKSYYFFDMQEIDLIKSTIKDQYPQKKNFFVMDFGAGNFELGEWIMVAFNKQKNLPSDISLTIISVRGEQYSGEETEILGKSKHYKIGSCKVEEISTELHRHGIDLENQLDICWSRWCFRHLVDPLGTFTQIFNMLHPGRGMFLGDGFFFEDATVPLSPNHQMVDLLTRTEAPFLMEHHATNCSLNRFIIKRLDPHPCPVPMRYQGVKRIDSNRYDCGSGCVTQFAKITGGEKYYIMDKFKSCPPVDYLVLCGSRSLFEWLKKNRLIKAGACGWSWRPIHFLR